MDKTIVYVFSGSNRHLLKQMFGDSGRPLYRLCQTLTLERMQREVYQKHLQRLAKTRWGKRLSENVVARVLAHTELHPFYVNVLCQSLWEKEQMPSPKSVSTQWHEFVKEQRYIISHDVSDLSLNQRKVITALSTASMKEIQSSKFTAPLKISASSAQQAVDVLISKDLVYRANDGLYCVLDPAVKYYLETILWDYG